MHKHLVVTATLSNPPKDPEYIKQWLRDLTQLVNMEIFIEPVAKYCDDPNNAGVTGTIVITTSHASVHIWDHGLFQADLYSCKDYDEATVVDFMINSFRLGTVKYQVIDRSI